MRASRALAPAPLLRPETPFDAPAIVQVLDAAFGPGRFAKPSERVRAFARHRPDLSRVAVGGGAVLGCCRLFDVRIGGAPGLFLGPLAVHPAAQHQGLGHGLAAAALAACRAGQEQAGGVILMGKAPFFAELGFALIPPGRVTLPGPAAPERLMWAPLRAGGLEGLAGAVARP